MKYSYLKMILFIFLFVNSSCTHKLMRTVSDAREIEINKNRFIGKPFKVLIKEISPQIKMVTGNPTNTFAEVPTFFQLFFVDKQAFALNSAKDVHSLRITVYIDQDSKNPPTVQLKKPDIWDSNKLKLYGNLIVKDIHITGGD